MNSYVIFVSNCTIPDYYAGVRLPYIRLKKLEKAEAFASQELAELKAEELKGIFPMLTFTVEKF